MHLLFKLTFSPVSPPLGYLTNKMIFCCDLKVAASWSDVAGWADAKTIAIGLGITTRGVREPKLSEIAAQFQFFHTFLPSFCETASPGYHYAFYLAYDHTDSLLGEATFLRAFQKAFRSTISTKCAKEVSVGMLTRNGDPCCEWNG